MRTAEPFTGGATLAVQSSPGRPVRVLVVDDEDDIRETVAEVLLAEGYDVETAPNGLEALRRVGDHPIDLVLLDLMMPVMDGWSFQTRLRADPKTASLCVVAVTASWDAGADPGFNAYLPKPFDLGQLLAIVGEFCPSK